MSHELYSPHNQFKFTIKSLYNETVSQSMSSLAPSRELQTSSPQKNSRRSKPPSPIYTHTGLPFTSSIYPSAAPFIPVVGGYHKFLQSSLAFLWRGTPHLRPSFLLTHASHILNRKISIGTSAPGVVIHYRAPLLLNPLILTSTRVRSNHHYHKVK